MMDEPKQAPSPLLPCTRRRRILRWCVLLVPSVLSLAWIAWMLTSEMRDQMAYRQAFREVDRIVLREAAYGEAFNSTAVLFEVTDPAEIRKYSTSCSHTAGRST